MLTATEFSERFRPAVACLTERGYFGLVPANAREGDIISILYGGAVPLRLRRSDDGKTCQVVGESYVHGIMHGEANYGARRGSKRDVPAEIGKEIIYGEHVLIVWLCLTRYLENRPASNVIQTKESHEAARIFSQSSQSGVVF